MNLEKVLIVGAGGREYSIALAVQKDERVKKLYFAPGNGATANLGENIDIKDFQKLADFVESEGIGFTIVGPEQPLVDGIVDIFESRGLTIFGSSKNASQLEGSKVFMKNFLKKHGIPTARFIETSSAEEAIEFSKNLPTPIVVKADGLCGGKGVIIAESHEKANETIREMLSGDLFGDAGKKVIVEEFLDGYELSVFAISDGKSFKILPAAQDHKRLLTDDKGPNTGGMGAYAPTPLIDDELYKKIEDRIIAPTLKGMESDGNLFRGVLFAGIMVVNGEPLTLEFNVRFGDPECEILMPLIETSVLEILHKASLGKLDEVDIKISNRYSVGVVMASGNYPYKSSEPAEIIVDEIVHEKLAENSHISFAGVSAEDGKLFATGGRVLVAVGLGDSIAEARDRAYMLCGQIHFAGKQFRTDIAYQALK
ncbi:phosphoribosylamine--glycine ligase [Thiovulum sp. ES]|nr:phosphoribosylamine--glycine ligase [Thiovulum sp. ES]